MRAYRILFTCVGRRVELVQEFKKAADKLGMSLEVIGMDSSLTAPALFFCDKSLASWPIKDENYIPSLLRTCKEEKVDALIPTIDTDLLILSENKKSFDEIGTKVLISDPDKIRICRDKRLTAKFFLSLGLDTPVPCDDYRKYDGGYPAFIKPKDGSSSINAYKVNDAEELKEYAKEVPDYIVAPYIEGKEYTIDAFCDFDGNPVYITPRERIAVRSGEVLKTRIDQDDTMIEEAKRIISSFRPRGAITIQLIRESKSGRDFFIEINPRFGGGAPLSMKAGAHSAEALLRLLAGEKVGYREYAAKDEAIYSRYDQSVCVKEGHDRD